MSDWAKVERVEEITLRKDHQTPLFEGLSLPPEKKVRKERKEWGRKE